MAVIRTESFSQSLVFKLNGKQINQYDKSQLSRIVKPSEITIYEPHEHKNRTYTGFSGYELLKSIYKQDLQSDKDLYITCTDGYKPSIPVTKFLTYESYFAFNTPGQTKFNLINKNQSNELVDLKPFYLIWDNIKYPELKKLGAYDFPYQIESVDLISFTQKFPNMSPPQNSSDQVNRGFVSYRKYCSTCHTINGEGGSKAVELNYPVNVTEYFNNKWLRKWIDDPASIRYGTKMPKLNPALDNRDNVIDDIIKYLSTMKNKKINPELN
ncbi:MAG: c-type cytochrome [Candidatus Dadabacteria bacterium]|nr:c-type cytochrome [Candidatus Dadabacteria bacterium]NIX15803.1 c-type cytochrome [Candidatus Dadabacteria bacterium]